MPFYLPSSTPVPASECPGDDQLRVLGPRWPKVDVDRIERGTTRTPFMEVIQWDIPAAPRFYVRLSQLHQPFCGRGDLVRSFIAFIGLRT